MVKKLCTGIAVFMAAILARGILEDNQIPFKGLE